MENFIIRLASQTDVSALLDIYTPYVLQTAITFEYDVPTKEEFARRMEQIQKQYPYLVAVADGKIVGYAYASVFKSRRAYDWAVETSIYVKKGEHAKGYGRKLYTALEEILKRQQVQNVNACITYTEQENQYLTNGSMTFHSRLGYQFVGRFHKCGYKFGQWFDMIWMEKMIGKHCSSVGEFIPILQLTGVESYLDNLYRRKFDFRAAIFDLDGTLWDSMDVWEHIDVKFLAKRGLEVPTDYMKTISVMRFEEAATYSIKRFGFSDSVEDLIKEWYDMAAYEYEHNVRLYPYVREYLLSLKQQGIKLAIATSSSEQLYLPCLKRNGILDLFEVHCSADKVGKGKGSPDLFLYVAKQLHVPIEEIIVFDDILEAVQSAKKAGMRVYGVSEKHSLENKAAICEIADGYIHDFREAPLPRTND